MSPDGQHEYFILVCTDAEHVDGSVVPALEVARARVRRRAWPLYDKTKHKLRLGPGDRCLVYIAGRAVARQSVIADCEVGSISSFSGDVALADDCSLLVDSPRMLLRFRDVHEFPSPVRLASLLARLSFVPRNLSKWGSAMQGGCRKISKKDYELLASSR